MYEFVLCKMLDGAKGSGHFSHAGIHGKQGGSKKSKACITDIDEYLSEVGVRKGQVVDVFGLRKAVLLSHVEKCMEAEMRGEFWRSVFKSEDDYLEAKNLRDKMQAENRLQDVNFIKLNRAVNRYEFVKGAAEYIKGKIEVSQSQGEENSSENEDVIQNNVKHVDISEATWKMEKTIPFYNADRLASVKSKIDNPSEFLKNFGIDLNCELDMDNFDKKTVLQFAPLFLDVNGHFNRKLVEGILQDKIEAMKSAIENNDLSQMNLNFQRLVCLDELLNRSSEFTDLERNEEITDEDRENAIKIVKEKFASLQKYSEVKGIFDDWERDLIEKTKNDDNLVRLLTSNWDFLAKLGDDAIFHKALKKLANGSMSNVSVSCDVSDIVGLGNILGLYSNTFSDWLCKSSSGHQASHGSDGSDVFSRHIASNNPQSEYSDYLQKRLRESAFASQDYFNTHLYVELLSNNKSQIFNSAEINEQCKNAVDLVKRNNDWSNGIYKLKADLELYFGEEPIYKGGHKSEIFEELLPKALKKITNADEFFNHIYGGLNETELAQINEGCLPDQQTLASFLTNCGLTTKKLPILKNRLKDIILDYKKANTLAQKKELLTAMTMHAAVCSLQEGGYYGQFRERYLSKWKENPHEFERACLYGQMIQLQHYFSVGGVATCDYSKIARFMDGSGNYFDSIAGEFASKRFWFSKYPIELVKDDFREKEHQLSDLNDKAYVSQLGDIVNEYIDTRITKTNEEGDNSATFKNLFKWINIDGLFGNESRAYYKRQSRETAAWYRELLDDEVKLDQWKGKKLNNRVLNGREIGNLLTNMTINGSHYNGMKMNNLYGTKNLISALSACGTICNSESKKAIRYENRQDTYRNYDFKVGDTVMMDGQHFSQSKSFADGKAKNFFGEREPTRFEIVGTYPFFNLEPHVYMQDGRAKHMVETEGLIGGFMKVKSVSYEYKGKQRTQKVELEYDWKRHKEYLQLQARQFANYYGMYGNDK